VKVTAFSEVQVIAARLLEMTICYITFLSPVALPNSRGIPFQPLSGALALCRFPSAGSTCLALACLGRLHQAVDGQRVRNSNLVMTFLEIESDSYSPTSSLSQTVRHRPFLVLAVRPSRL